MSHLRIVTNESGISDSRSHYHGPQTLPSVTTGIAQIDETRTRRNTLLLLLYDEGEGESGDNSEHNSGFDVEVLAKSNNSNVESAAGGG